MTAIDADERCGAEFAPVGFFDYPQRLVSGAKLLSQILWPRERLVVCNESGAHLRAVQDVVVRPGQSIKEAVAPQLAPGEKFVMVRERVSSGDTCGLTRR